MAKYFDQRTRGAQKGKQPGFAGLGPLKAFKSIMVRGQGAPGGDQDYSAMPSNKPSSNPSPMGKVGPLNATRDHSNDGSAKPYDPQLQNSLVKSSQSYYNPTSSK